MLLALFNPHRFEGAERILHDAVMRYERTGIENWYRYATLCRGRA